MLNSKHRLDVQALRLPVQLRGLSQPIPARLWSLYPVDPLHGREKVVCYLSDEIFAIGVPIFATLEAQSTAILQIELATDRSAATWQRHFEELGKHLFRSIGMASDLGTGLVAGYQAACQDGRWVSHCSPKFDTAGELTAPRYYGRGSCVRPNHRGCKREKIVPPRSRRGGSPLPHI